MVIVTGGAGFIGSAIVWRLNTLSKTDIIIVDELGTSEKWKNLVGLKYHDFINKDDFLKRIENEYDFSAESIIHMGANSSTTEKDADLLMKNNYEYTKTLTKYSVKNNIRFIYASSAAAYGDGSAGFNDAADGTKLRPLNMYGYSKHFFDLWAERNNYLDKITGLKYFNVYGPNEYHKGDMRSVVHKAYEQILQTGKVKLFKSLNPKYKDGEQMRDFIYIKDAVDMTLYFLNNKNKNGLFNVGSGKARTWNDLAKALFKSLKTPVNIEYIDLPEYLADKYQYLTEADLNKIKGAGCSIPITSLEEGIEDYVHNYLQRNEFLGY